MLDKPPSQEYGTFSSSAPEKWVAPTFFVLSGAWQGMDEAGSEAQLRALVEPIVAEAGMELVELVSRPRGGQQMVRLLVDQAGGVTIQQCAAVNERIGQALEAADVFAGGYTIEVSSPGLDRPLSTRRDFERAVGEDLRVMADPGDGRPKELTGMLLAVQPEAIVLKMKAGNVTIPLSQITMAKKAVRW